MVLASYVGAALAAMACLFYLSRLKPVLQFPALKRHIIIITRHSGILLAGIQLCLCLNSLLADLFALS